MKICIDCRLLSEKPTGISRLTRDLIRYYTRAYGVENILCIVSEDTPHLDLVMIQTSLNPFNILHFFLFRKFIRSLSIDILHSPFYSSLYRRLPGVKTMVTLPDIMYRFTPGFFGSSLLRNIAGRTYFDLIVRASLNSADEIISISKATALDLNDWLGKKATVIYPVVEMDDSDGDAEILKVFSLQKNEYFFYIGNSRPHKNLDYLIGAYSNSNSKMELIIAGNSVFVNQDRRIRGIGPVSDNQLLVLYKNMRCLVFPSKYEGFGLPLVEATLLGKKAIASDIPVFKELANPLITLVSIDSPKALCEEIEFQSSDEVCIINEYRGIDFSFSRFSRELDIIVSRLNAL